MTEIDFYVVENKDPKIIMVIDDSYWGHTEAANSYIGVILPGREDVINFSFRKNTVNILNSINLGLNCNESKFVKNDLPDGIYTIKVFSAVEAVERTKYCLRVDVLRSRLYKAVYKIGAYDNASPQKKKMVTDFVAMEQFAEASLSQGDIKRTQYLYEKMEEMVEKINCANC